MSAASSARIPACSLVLCLGLEPARADVRLGAMLLQFKPSAERCVGLVEGIILGLGSRDDFHVCSPEEGAKPEYIAGRVLRLRKLRSAAI